MLAISVSIIFATLLKGNVFTSRALQSMFVTLIPTYEYVCTHVCVCVHACLTVTNTDTSSLFLPLVRFLLVGLKSFNSFRNCGILSFIGFFSRFLLGALESGTLV